MVDWLTLVLLMVIMLMLP